MRRAMINAYFSGAEYPPTQVFPPEDEGLQVFLVAIPQEAPAFARPEAPGLQRVHVAVLPPAGAPPFDSPVALLPPLHQVTMRRSGTCFAGLDPDAGPRLVRGEILSSRAGCFYEKIGRQIVPLRKLAAGPYGEVLEVPAPAGRGRNAATVRANREWEWWNDPTAGSHEAEEDAIRPGNEPIDVPSAGHESGAGFRQLFPSPGKRCTVRLGDFRGVLRPQIAHPERLRDSHFLACFVQVYEVTRAQRMESLATTVARASEQTPQLLTLSHDAVMKLGLAEDLRRLPWPPRYRQRVAGVLLPGERAIQLQLAQDPTAGGANSDRDVACNKQQATVPVTERARQTVAATQPPVSLKTTVPDAYLKPWDFKLSRDEALYDLNVEASSCGLLRSFWRNLKRLLGGRSEFRRWQTLLAAKSPEEQLWTVRPPNGWSTHPSLQDWAKRTLQLSGYDPASMLLEWEIFWRRKGM